VLLLLHEPPGKVLLSVMVVFVHTTPGPVIAVGIALVVKVIDAEQPLPPYEAVMVVTPALAELIIPVVEPMVATAGTLLLHVALLVNQLKVLVPPAQSELLPVIGVDGSTSVIDLVV
jgi:hypothetical protein